MLQTCEGGSVVLWITSERILITGRINHGIRGFETAQPLGTEEAQGTIVRYTDWNTNRGMKTQFCSVQGSDAVCLSVLLIASVKYL